MPGRLPTIDDFPKNLKVSILPPQRDGHSPTNMVIYLHGLGDTNVSFANLAKQMKLPEAACISIQGPKPLLDLDGFHWGDDIIFDNNTGGIDADAGLRESTELLRIIMNDVLVAKCGYKPREVMMFGFGQGGMAALSAAVAIHQDAKAKYPALTELGGIISIGAGLPSEAPASLDPKCKTPVLVCAGSDQSSVTPSSEDKLKQVFELVEVKRYRKPGDSMPSNRDEMLPIMQFLSRRLRSVSGVREGSVEIG